MNAQDAEARTAEMALAYRTTFSTVEGQTVLADLAAFAGMDAADFADILEPNPLALAAQEGKRRMVHRILGFVARSELDVAAGLHAARVARQEERRAAGPGEAKRPPAMPDIEIGVD